MVDGTLRTMLQSGLPPNEVLDLVPVKPLGEDEPSFTKAYRERLKAVFDRIRPAVMTA
jgi:pyrroline-5-carboxylate reductase